MYRWFVVFYLFFFFKQKTAYEMRISDWSSDVCSSDLAALVNTLSAGDRVLMYETGWFATLWRELAGKLGLDADFVSGDWRHGADAEIGRASCRERVCQYV